METFPHRRLTPQKTYPTEDLNDSGARMRRVGIDVGGTFTDVILIDDATGALFTAKVPTTPANPVEGALNGVRRILDPSASAAPDIGFIGHGTTIATNLLLD